MPFQMIVAGYQQEKLNESKLAYNEDPYMDGHMLYLAFAKTTMTHWDDNGGIIGELFIFNMEGWVPIIISCLIMTFFEILLIA